MVQGMGLKLTGQNEKDDPVHHKNGPEDWHVEDLEPTANERNDNSPRRPVPELELGESANKWPKFLILLGGEGTNGAILHLVVERIV